MTWELAISPQRQTGMIIPHRSAMVRAVATALGDCLRDGPEWQQRLNAEFGRC